MMLSLLDGLHNECWCLFNLIELVDVGKQAGHKCKWKVDTFMQYLNNNGWSQVYNARLFYELDFKHKHNSQFQLRGFHHR